MWRTDITSSDLNINNLIRMYWMKNKQHQKSSRRLLPYKNFKESTNKKKVPGGSLKYLPL